MEVQVDESGVTESALFISRNNHEAQICQIQKVVCIIAISLIISTDKIQLSKIGRTHWILIHPQTCMAHIMVTCFLFREFIIKNVFEVPWDDPMPKNAPDNKLIYAIWSIHQTINLSQFLFYMDEIQISDDISALVQIRGT